MKLLLIIRDELPSHATVENAAIIHIVKNNGMPLSQLSILYSLPWKLISPRTLYGAISTASGPGEAFRHGTRETPEVLDDRAL